MDVPGADLEDGIGVYLDGFAYSGILNLQTQVQKWPATTGVSQTAHEALDSLHRQSYIPRPSADEIAASIINDSAGDQEIQKTGSQSIL